MNDRLQFSHVFKDGALGTIQVNLSDPCRVGFLMSPPCLIETYPDEYMAWRSIIMDEVITKCTTGQIFFLAQRAREAKSANL